MQRRTTEGQIAAIEARWSFNESAYVQRRPGT